MKLLVVLGLNIAMIAGLVIVGLTSHSLGVLAAGGDYLADAAAIGISYLALRISQHPKGHQRATLYAALLNTVLMLGVTVFVIFTAVQRLLTHTPEIEGLSVMIVSIVATLVMILGAFILKDPDEEDLNMRAVLIDTIADAISSAGVAIFASIILYTGKYYWLDSAVALGISLFIGYTSIKLLQRVIAEFQEF